MFKDFVFFFVFLFLQILNCANVDSNDDVLLVSQVSITNRCCITPLVVQRGGATSGPRAEWVDARFYVSNGSETEELAGGKMNWTLGWGGTITLPSADKIWHTLQIHPEINESTQELLRMTRGESLLFEIEIENTMGITQLNRNAIMVRQLGAKITRKKIAYVMTILSNFDKPKGGIEISTL